jgi:hypothetical protein
MKRDVKTKFTIGISQFFSHKANKEFLRYPHAKNVI